LIGQPALDWTQAPPLHLRVRQGAVVLDGNIVARGQEEHDGQQDQQGRDDDPHAEQAAVHELDDVQVSLGCQQIVDTQHQGGDEICKGPDEDQQGPGDIPGRGERQGDVPGLAPAPRAHALGRLFQGRIHLGQGVQDIERDHGEEMQGLHQEHALNPVHEVDGLQQVEIVHQEDVHCASPSQDEDEAQDAHQRRRDDGDQGEIGEQIPERKLVADQEEGHHDPDHRGGHHGRHAQENRVPEGAEVEPVGEELLEVHQGELSGLVGKGVVEDPGERVHEEENEKGPDEAEPQEGHNGGARSCSGGRDGDGVGGGLCHGKVRISRRGWPGCC